MTLPVRSAGFRSGEPGDCYSEGPTSGLDEETRPERDPHPETSSCAERDPTDTRMIDRWTDWLTDWLIDWLTLTSFVNSTYNDSTNRHRPAITPPVLALRRSRKPSDLRSWTRVCCSPENWQVKTALLLQHWADCCYWILERKITNQTCKDEWLTASVILCVSGRDTDQRDRECKPLPSKQQLRASVSEQTVALKRPYDEKRSETHKTRPVQRIEEVSGAEHAGGCSHFRAEHAGKCVCTVKNCSTD